MRSHSPVCLRVGALSCVAFFVGCGGTAAGSSRGGTTPSVSAPSCGLDAATMAAALPIVVPGTRVRVRVPHPDEAVLLRGSPAVAHACGLSISVVSAPPDPDAGAYLDGIVQGILAESARMGMRCGTSRDGTEWRCTDGRLTSYTRRISVPGAAVVVVMGPTGDSRAFREISGSATYEPTEPFDALVQMSIALDPPEGMALTSLSTAGHLTYLEPGAEDTPRVPSVNWQYQLYATHPRHTDGGAWTTRELAESMGRLAATDMGALDPATVSVQEGASGGAVTTVTVAGARDGVPTLAYVRAVRDTVGVFFAVAYIPTPLVPTWLPRIEAHARSLRILGDGREEPAPSEAALPDVPDVRVIAAPAGE